MRKNIMSEIFFVKRTKSKTLALFSFNIIKCLYVVARKPKPISSVWQVNCTNQWTYIKYVFKYFGKIYLRLHADTRLKYRSDIKRRHFPI